MGDKLFKNTELFIFDMDGLLFNTEDIYVNEGKRIAREMGYEITQELSEMTMGLTNNVARKTYKDYLGQESPFDEMVDEIHSIICERAEKGEVDLKLGALELLNFLKENNKKMVLATSSNRKLTTILTEGKDIRKYFDHFITAEDVKHGKPDPEVFLIAAKRGEAKPEKSIVFEDSFNGVRAAHSAKTFPFMIPDKLQPTEEIRQKYFKKFDNLLEVINYFEGK